MLNNRLRTLSPSFPNYVRLLPIIINVLVNIQMRFSKTYPNAQNTSVNQPI